MTTFRSTDVVLSELDSSPSIIMSTSHSPAGDDETIVSAVGKSSGGKKASAVSGSAFALEFLPTTGGDPSPHLAPLRDNHSNYAAVTKACVFLNGFSASGTLAASIDSQTVALSTLVHDPTYVQIMETAFTSLIECIQTHEDRLCRILACKTLAMVARAAYAQIRHPLLFSVRESTTHSLEDQVGTDVPVRDMLSIVISRLVRKLTSPLPLSNHFIRCHFAPWLSRMWMTAFLLALLKPWVF
jgi:hypothetical protein